MQKNNKKHDEDTLAFGFLCGICGGRMKAKGYCWRCVDCGRHVARKWKSDPRGAYGIPSGAKSRVREG